MSGMGSNPHEQQGHRRQDGESHGIAHGMLQASSSSTPPPCFMGKESEAYDVGDLDKALLLYMDGHEQKQTLNIFPSRPMHVEPSTTKNGASLVASSTGSSQKSFDKSTEFGNQRSYIQPPGSNTGEDVKAVVKREREIVSSSKGTQSRIEKDRIKTPDPKTLRRLAQNREAARKSRLRKKAYVQQLEHSRIKLNQLELDLQRTRAQGIFHGGGTATGDQYPPIGMGGLSPEAAMFDMEYGRWLEEHHHLLCELRAAVQEQIGENQLRIIVENCVAHHDQLTSLKAAGTKIDVFHIVSGNWKTPAERFFLWMGDFRPSHVIKLVSRHIEPLSQQQLLAVCSLQQSMQEAEDVLSQGLDSLHQSLSDTVASDALGCPSNVAAYMGHMLAAVGKLSTLESFVQQADALRQQTLHRLPQILTTAQAARGFLAIAEYFHRLRALSSLWLARPRQE